MIRSAYTMLLMMTDRQGRDGVQLDRLVVGARTCSCCQMAMRWRLWEDDFHASMFDASAECREDDTAKPCRCSGRGRPRPQLADLRLPYALRVQVRHSYLTQLIS